jgi:hypothetical protein
MNMLNVNAIGDAFVAANGVVVATTPIEQPKPVAAPAAAAPSPDAALLARRDAKVLSIVLKLKPSADKDFAKERYAKGLPVGTMVKQVRGYFLDLYRASHPAATPAKTADPAAAMAAMKAAHETSEQACMVAVNSLIQGALDRGVIWESFGKPFAYYYSSAEYPKPVSRAAVAHDAAKAEAAELGW